MKRVLLIFAMFLLSSYEGRAQAFESRYDSKIDDELMTYMSGGGDAVEMFPIIVLMKEQYDHVSMNQKTMYMDRKARRDFVTGELKRFVGERQADVARVMNECVRGNSVRKLNQFWIFNGFSCLATRDVIELIASRDDVAMVSSDRERQMIPQMEMTSQPVDDARGIAWNVTKVNADAVWSFYGSTGYSGKDVVVAVIDTGVNYNHTDIANNMWDDGNGSHGYDYVNDDNDPMDDQGHGTHCAGTVAGYGTNGTQTGVAPGAKIMAIKVLSASGSGTIDAIVSGIEFALDNGADVLSLSLGASGIGGYWYYRYVFEAVLAVGVPASVAAGNDGGRLGEYPVPNNIGAPGNCPPPYLHPDQSDILAGGMTAVISVGATDKNDVHADFTSVGPATWASGDYIGTYGDYPYAAGSGTQIGLIRPDIAAPGCKITSLDYSGTTGYCNMDGTSMATPCNAGVIALMLEANPLLTPREIDSILEHTASRCEGSKKKNNYTGSGRIDAYTAVTAALGGCNAPTALTASLSDNDVTLTWNAADDITSYSVFRNNTLIANAVYSTNYTDADLPIYGTYSYCVKSNRTGGGNSMASNVADVFYTYPGPTISDLNGDVEGHNVTLEWTTLDKKEKQKYYGNSYIYCGGFGTESRIYWSQRYPASVMSDCFGMAVKSIKIYIPEASTYDYAIYQGNTTTPENRLTGTSVTFTSTGWKTIELTSPAALDCTKDMWVVFSNLGAENPIAYCFCSNSDYASLLSDNGASWELMLEYLSWSIVVNLTDDVYTYNIYRDGVKIAADESGSSFSYTEPDNGFHEYHLTTNYFGKESQPSNIEDVAVGSTNQFIGGYGADWSEPSNWSEGTPASSDKVWIKNDALITNDVDLNSMYVNDGASVTVAAGNTLRVTGDVENHGGVTGLVIESDAAFMCNSQDVSCTVNRQMTASTSRNDWTGKWHFLSSPVTTAHVSDFTGNAEGQNYDLYVYSEPDEMWYNEKSDNHNVNNKFYTVNGMDFNPGKGYLTSFGKNTMMSFKGEMNNGEHSMPVTASSTSDLVGFNLIGNPYPCSIDWDAASGWTRDVLGDAPYIWIYNPELDQYGTYQTGNGGIGTNGVTNIIAPCQGFFVKAIEKGNVKLDDDVKTAAKTTFRKNNDADVIKIMVTGKNGSDEVMVCKNSDNNVNAEKLFSRNEYAPSLYLNVDEGRYSIVNKQENGELLFPLGFIAGMTGTFTVSSDSDIELVDTFTGNVTDLSSSSYEFIGSVADNADRFLIRIPDGSGDGGFVYQSGDDLIVKGSGRVQVFDCLGRVVIDEYANGGRIDVSALKTGVYVVRVENRNQKIVIR